MQISARLDDETEELLFKAATALNATRTEILKASIREFCRKTLEVKAKKPYDLIEDLVGSEFSGKGNLAMDGEKILRPDILPMNAKLTARCRVLMKKYRNLPMDLADGTLVAVAEDRKIEEVFTLDHWDFNIYSRDQVKHFQILPELP